MTFKKGQSGNPAGMRPGTRRKRPTALVLRIMKERNDTDPLALLSTIVTTAEAPKSGGLVSDGAGPGVRLTLTASCVGQIQVNSRYNCRRGTSWLSI